METRRLTQNGPAADCFAAIPESYAERHTRAFGQCGIRH
jgi:hypothetical protein